jgi:hypothetical protein
MILTNTLINDILLDSDRGTDFLLTDNKAQSRSERLNRFSIADRNVPFLLEKVMKEKRKYGKRIISKCPNCKKEFWTIPSRPVKFCSRKCYINQGHSYQFKKGDIPWNKGTHIYNGGGSKKGCPAWNKGMSSKVKKHCLTCGNEFMAYLCGGKYCSRKCRPPWNKGKRIFKTLEEKRVHKNKIRIEQRRYNLKEKVADRIRTLIRNSISRHNSRDFINYKKLSKTKTLLGCDVRFFKTYLEKQFKIGMSWDNYGNGHNKWNIDHIKPVSKFNLTKLSEQKKAFHFTNCQPMWAIENIKKGNH